MKAGIWPVDHAIEVALFHRGEMHVIPMRPEILVITDTVFPSRSCQMAHSSRWGEGNIAVNLSGIRASGYSLLLSHYCALMQLLIFDGGASKFPLIDGIHVLK